MNAEEKKTRCGYVALVGRPNAGKSTLLNRVLGQKVSIVTPKPQTTRNRILAVHNVEGDQIVFLDTPGLHRPRGSLGRYMVEAAASAILEADLVAFLIDMAEPGRPPGFTEEEEEIAARLQAARVPILALPNKVDLVADKKRLLPVMERAAALEGVAEVIPICAFDGDGVELFVDAVRGRLPEGPRLYPDDVLSDQAERFFVAELVREAVTELTRQEIPYHSAVVIERFVEEKTRCSVHATIHVERASQRGILIGKHGVMIKEIGIRARDAAEKFLGCRVDLMLHVDVSPGWTDGPEGLKRMGYE
ncbi:MAG: GTPase Era [Deltaproteobacteria bacterium]|nr:GTPase Era [Deltaproteobacteria bacterium]